jgi:hypothetical protein
MEHAVGGSAASIISMVLASSTYEFFLRMMISAVQDLDADTFEDAEEDEDGRHGETGDGAAFGAVAAAVEWTEPEPEPEPHQVKLRGGFRRLFQLSSSGTRRTRSFAKIEPSKPNAEIDTDIHHAL